MVSRNHPNCPNCGKQLTPINIDKGKNFVGDTFSGRYKPCDCLSPHADEGKGEDELKLKGKLTVEVMKSIYTVIKCDGAIKEEDKLSYLFGTIQKLHEELSLPAAKNGEAEEYWQSKKMVFTGINAGEYMDKEDFLAFTQRQQGTEGAKFYIDEIHELVRQYNIKEISISKFTELLNDKVNGKQL